MKPVANGFYWVASIGDYCWEIVRVRDGLAQFCGETAVYKLVPNLGATEYLLYDAKGQDSGFGLDPKRLQSPGEEVGYGDTGSD